MQNNKKEIISESADLIFHWLLLLVNRGITIADVMAELKNREGISGLDEKAQRKK
jgi:phosphoribosyl-ATP pyrophosphohydrolase